MLVEVLYKNGHKERRLCAPSDTLISFVQTCEAQHGSKIQNIKVVKRVDRNQANGVGD